jgi:hypothetical protein
MSYGTTPIDGIRVPDHNEKVADIWRASGYVAQDVEPFTNMRFTNMADLTTKLTGVNAPADGMQAYVDDVGQLLLYVNGAWKRVYPVERQILSGTTVPAASLGAVNDIYMQF